VSTISCDEEICAVKEIGDIGCWNPSDNKLLEIPSK
jgi:hypothetical protein